jgi:hypothetical protein
MRYFVSSVMVDNGIGGVLIGQNDKASAVAVLEGHVSSAAVKLADADLLAIATRLG